MSYNNMIARSEVVIPAETSQEIIQATAESSIALRLGRRLQNMAASQRTLPVMSVLPVAYFVGPAGAGDAGLKQTAEANWEGITLTAEEIAVIVPIPEAVLDDAAFDIWGEIKPHLVEAFGKVIDAAVFHGTNKPASWPEGLATQAAAAGNAVSAGADLYADLMGEAGVIGLVEQDGFLPTGHVGAVSMRGKLRTLRDENGQPIFKSTLQGPTSYELDGAPLYFPMNGGLDPAQTLLISGDWSKLVYSMRQDMTYKILSEAVIQDSTGAIVYNLAQQDMVALRAVMRLGWQLPNPATRAQANRASRCPFAVLRPV